MEPQETILIVEDEAGPRAALRMILKPIYIIHTTSNGKEALEVIRDQKIDLVTLDLNMPGLSGIEVLKEIKKIKPDVEIIIVTAEGSLAKCQSGDPIRRERFHFQTVPCGRGHNHHQKIHRASKCQIETQIFDRANQRFQPESLKRLLYKHHIL